MKKIVKTIPERTVVSYQCGKCGKKYRSSKRAKKCDSMPVEKKLFRVGSLVSWRELRTCVYGGNYYLKGLVIEVLGPTLLDEEYNIKWLHEKLNGLHVYQYKVAWNCEHCNELNSGLFYGMELIKCESTKISKRNKTA